MARGKDYVGNLSEIQERFCHGKYKGGPTEKVGTFWFLLQFVIRVYYDNNWLDLENVKLNCICLISGDADQIQTNNPEVIFRIAAIVLVISTCKINYCLYTINVYNKYKLVSSEILESFSAIAWLSKKSTNTIQFQ